MKQIAAHFDFSTLTQKQYDQVWDDTKASGYEHPDGLLFHVGSAKPDGGWMFGNQKKPLNVLRIS
jgi:hypothetical protein